MNFLMLDLLYNNFEYEGWIAKLCIQYKVINCSKSPNLRLWLRVWLPTDFLNLLNLNLTGIVLYEVRGIVLYSYPNLIGIVLYEIIGICLVTVWDKRNCSVQLSKFNSLIPPSVDKGVNLRLSKSVYESVLLKHCKIETQHKISFL